MEFLDDLLNVVAKADQATTTSLAAFSKAAIIQSPMFISEQVREEPALKNIVSNVYNIYIGYILTSLRLNQRVQGSRTVRDILATVSTEIVGANEAFKGAEDLAEMLSGSLEVQARYTDPKSMKVDLPVGKIVEIEIDVPNVKDKNGNPTTIKIPLTVRLNPRIIPSSVVEYVMDTEFGPSVSQRWLQAQAGEIRFVKDFIFQMDRLDKRETALKNDKDRALEDIYRQRQKSTLRHFLKILTMSRGGNVQSNLACSVFIFDKEQIDQLGKKKGFDLFKLDDRRRFFSKTYSLFCILIDVNYSRVHILTNGIDDIATYTFNEFKSTNQDDNIKDILEAFTRNQLPKF